VLFYSQVVHQFLITLFKNKTMDDQKLFIVLDFINNNDFPLINSPEHLPENIGFTEYLTIIEFLEQKEYIESIDNDLIYNLTDVGSVNFESLRKNIKQQSKDELAEINCIMNL